MKSNKCEAKEAASKSYGGSRSRGVANPGRVDGIKNNKLINKVKGIIVLNKFSYIKANSGLFFFVVRSTGLLSSPESGIRLIPWCLPRRESRPRGDLKSKASVQAKDSVSLKQNSLALSVYDLKMRDDNGHFSWLFFTNCNSDIGSLLKHSLIILSPSTFLLLSYGPSFFPTLLHSILITLPSPSTGYSIPNRWLSVYLLRINLNKINFSKKIIYDKDRRFRDTILRMNTTTPIQEHVYIVINYSIITINNLKFFLTKKIKIVLSLIHI